MKVLLYYLDLEDILTTPLTTSQCVDEGARRQVTVRGPIEIESVAGDRVVYLGVWRLVPLDRHVIEVHSSESNVPKF